MVVYAAERALLFDYILVFGYNRFNAVDCAGRAVLLGSLDFFKCPLHRGRHIRTGFFILLRKLCCRRFRDLFDVAELFFKFACVAFDLDDQFAALRHPASPASLTARHFARRIPLFASAFSALSSCRKKSVTGSSASR